MTENDIDLTGTIDLHIHTAPDVSPRKLDDLEAARQAAARGMRAILLKSHVTLTADRAALVERVVPGVRVFGGLVLNESVGGFNPAAVEAALRLGAAEIWMPTLSSASEPRPRPAPGLTVLDEHGLKPNVHEILRLIAEQNVILGTGHLSPAEILQLVPAARAAGVRKILITHPEHPPVEMPLPLQEELRDRYHVYFERCLITTDLGGGRLSFAALASIIRRVGCATTVVATDFGQAENPSPVDGLATYIAHLQAEGFSDADVAIMTRTNPARLLELEHD
jgi:Family of unknown function (DUF6282)